MCRWTACANGTYSCKVQWTHKVDSRVHAALASVIYEYEQDSMMFTSSNVGEATRPPDPGLCAFFWLLNSVSLSRILPVDADIGCNCVSKCLAPLSGAIHNIWLGAFTEKYCDKNSLSLALGILWIFYNVSNWRLSGNSVPRNGLYRCTGRFQKRCFICKYVCLYRSLYSLFFDTIIAVQQPLWNWNDSVKLHEGKRSCEERAHRRELYVRGALGQFKG